VQRLAGDPRVSVVAGLDQDHVAVLRGIDGGLDRGEVTGATRIHDEDVA
jgi:hypothetical protein